MGKGRSTFGCVQRMSRDVYRLRWHEDTPEGRKRRSETVYGTRREAELRMAEIHTTVGKSYGGTPTVAECYERWWLPEAKARLEEGSLSKSSFVNFESHWKNHVGKKWGDVPIDKIRKDAIVDWLQGMTAGTARISRSLARQVLEFPVRYDVVQSNPFDVKVRMPTKARPHQKDVYDLDTLLDVALAFRGSPLEAAVILAGLGSCRMGESLAVRGEDVFQVDAGGFRFAAAAICKQVPRMGGDVTDKLKNKWSYRSVLLPEAVGDRLLEIASAGGWLCDDGTGSPLTYYAAKNLWTDGLASAGFKHIPFRNLRNSWKTAMEHEVGVKHETIEKLMGHVSEGTSGKYYDRPRAEQLAESYAKAYANRRFASSWDILGHKDVMQAVYLGL